MKHLFTLAALCCQGTLAAAQTTTIYDPARFDTDAPKGKLTQPEIAAYERFMSDSVSEDREFARAHYRKELAKQSQAHSGKDGIPISSLGTPERPDPCASSREFFIRESVIDVPQFGCFGFNKIPNGARLSFGRNYEAESRSFALKGGIAAPIYRGPGPKTRSSNKRGMILDSWYLAVFIEADGTLKWERDAETGEESETDTGFVRSGLKTDFVYEGGVFETVALTTALYFQTDMDLNAEGYGLKASVIPQRAKWHMGAHPNQSRGGKEDPVQWYWTPSLSLDAFQPVDDGSADLDADETYIWLGAGLEASVLWQDFGSHGAALGAGATFNQDLSGGEQASLGHAQLELFLDPSRKSSISLRYEKGRKYQTLADVETFDLNLVYRY